MNIYNLLSEAEKEQVNQFSLKVNTEKRTEPLFYRSQLVGNYMLQLFKKNHPAQAEAINRQQEMKNMLAKQCIEHITWEANIYGQDK